MEPSGNFEPTFMAATICAVMVNIVASLYSTKKDRVKILTPIDFMPNWDIDIKEEIKPDQSIADMKAVMTKLVDASVSKQKAYHRIPKSRKRTK